MSARGGLRGPAALKLGLVFTAACAGRVPPLVQAAAVERMQCDSPAAAGDDSRVLENTAVLEAGPAYSKVLTGKNGTEDRVTGAEIIVRPPAGVSPEQLTRTLQCHSARVLLGHADQRRFADDPYWLPDTWLDIQVKSDNGNYAVVLAAGNVPDGLQVLHRATAFAEARRTGVEP
jgi:hypothetical protein